MMLDEIINYVQSLQRQVEVCTKNLTPASRFVTVVTPFVETFQKSGVDSVHFLQFLSMKLSTLNPRMDFNLEAFLSKDVS